MQNDFKIIAIRPLKNCGDRVRKNIATETTYHFFSNYQLLPDKKGYQLIEESGAPDFLYKIKDTQIHISAVVGRNGSGKSSLLELMYVAFYNLSCIYNILEDEETKQKLTVADIEPDIHVDLIYKTSKGVYLLRVSGKEASLYKASGQGPYLFDLNLNPKPFSKELLYYILAINYSHHALNSKYLGEWLKKVFHKNDAYQTPIVINPYRDEGVIDINKEEYLIKARLLANILSVSGRYGSLKDSLRNLIDDKIAMELALEVDDKKFTYKDKEKKQPHFALTENYGKVVLPIVYYHFLNDSEFEPEGTLLNKYAKEYIIKKLKTITEKYDSYREFEGFLNPRIKIENQIVDILDLREPKKIDRLIAKVKKDPSHIAFKIHQAVNFLTNKTLNKKKSTKFVLPIPQLGNTLKKLASDKDAELINYLPPAFFKTNILFKGTDSFERLSSGEKQKVYSLSTLAYSLTNLNSVNTSHGYTRYEHVSIVFDEIELYHHPEMQRRMINDVLDMIKRARITNIKAIHILFLTHSPFILSDIPGQNVLYLNQDGTPNTEKTKHKTFGNNLYDLLNDNFYLGDSFIGAFATDRIKDLFTLLHSKSKTTTAQKNKISEEISLVAEPYLNQKLLEAYYLKFEKEKRIKQLEAELKRMKRK